MTTSFSRLLIKKSLRYSKNIGGKAIKLKTFGLTHLNWVPAQLKNISIFFLDDLQ